MEGRMNTEARLVLAIVLMIAVLVGTNLLFPTGPAPESADESEPAAEVVAEPEPAEPEPAEPETTPRLPEAEPPADPELPASIAQEGEVEADDVEDLVEEAEGAERVVRVEGPLYTFTFSDRGARVTSLQLPRFRSFAREGPVELVANPEVGMLGSRVLVGGDTIDLRGAAFEVEPEGGLTLEEGGEGGTLTFTYRHPTEPFSLQVAYDFDPESYTVRARGRVQGIDRGLLLTDMGQGLAFNEESISNEAREMAYVGNHIQNGIRSRSLSDVEAAEVDEGPFHWAALKSQYFVLGILSASEAGGTEYFGGIVARPATGADERESADVAVTQSLGSAGGFEYRIYAGPQDYALLAAMGHDFQQVNPVGWRFIRPILRPFVGIITTVLVFLHEFFSVGYGWVLIIFGVSMRILLFPLNHKAMRAQLRNLAVQPLLKDIQTKYKDQPEKMQKELMKLYKEHGFNPLAGCWPMLLPWPVLIALFFVFQNTIELRGVPFAWLPDLASRDPFFVLPVLLGISMFLMQWISFRTMEEINPQMKMMMWLLPIFMVVVFANLPSGLNLYYLTANLATLPQSWWIANERKKVQAKGPPVAVKAPAET
jgi:YidC/Oxa1 family membrane protein insertase